MIFIGIDPGVTGAIATITMNGLLDKHPAVVDMPVFQKMKAGERITYDIMGILELLRVYSCRASIISVILEEPNAMPKNGSIANFSVGYGLGLCRMVVAAHGYQVEYVKPAKWKKAMGLPANKDASRQKAIELFPQMSEKLKLKKHHGRAEALLLAEYGRRLHNGKI